MSQQNNLEKQIAYWFGKLNQAATSTMIATENWKEASQMLVNLTSQLVQENRRLKQQLVEKAKKGKKNEEVSPSK